MQKNQLLALLKAYDVPLDKWGTGEAKTFEDLFSEVKSGESVIVEDWGRLIRSGEGAASVVYYATPEHIWKLREDKQVFKDGRVKRRKLTTSIGEKIHLGESVVHAAYRAFEEELNIFERVPLIPVPPIIKGPVPSDSFPGLFSHYTIHVFEVLLPKHLYKPEGYVEKQEKKTNYYVWDRMT